MYHLRLCIYFNPIHIEQRIINPLIGGDKTYYEEKTIYCYDRGCVVHETPFHYKIIVVDKGVVNIWREVEGIIHVKDVVCIEAHGDTSLLLGIMNMFNGHHVVKEIRVW